MNPLLLDFPEQFESERLLIRAPRVGDGAEINALIQLTIEDLHPWMPWANPVPTPEQSEEWARRAISRWTLRESLPMLLYLKETQQFIGSAGIPRADWLVPKFEIGYWIGKPFARKGYVTEAVNRVTRFAFEDLNAERVEIRCDNLNVRSARVAERAGFALEGILRNDGRSLNGDLRSTRVYAKISG